MYFVVIMAFALVLSDTLPLEQGLLPLFHRHAPGDWVWGLPAQATLVVVLCQILLLTVAAFVTKRLTLARLTETSEGYDRATGIYAAGQRVLLVLLGLTLAASLIFTPWAPIVREGWQLGRIPLLGDLAVLGPFTLCVLIVWIFFYGVESQIRRVAQRLAASDESEAMNPSPREAHAALAASRRGRRKANATLAAYLGDKFRHQILIVAAPMAVIAFAKYFTDLYKGALVRWTTLPWAADSLLGIVSAMVLVMSPFLLRYVWATEPLPAGALRERFVRTCRRIRLRYREILLWHTHRTAINAAVMGFFAPLRYILVSDALLETMDEEEIEAVFGHEAGHVRHWHLQYFVLFAIITMYIAGGVMQGLWFLGHHFDVQWLKDFDILQLVALAVLLAAWLFAFGWISRRFEHQADLYGVRCVTPDIKTCVAWCPIHGSQSGPPPTGQAVSLPPPGTLPDFGFDQSSVLCVTAAHLFGRTLTKIADLNGISREASSWRHGSIDERCRLIERLATNPAALARFERQLRWMKLGLILATLVGTVGAVLVYSDDILRAIHVFRSR